MAVILKKQRSLYYFAAQWTAMLFIVVVVGRLLLKVSPFITIASLCSIPWFIHKIMNIIVGAFGEYLVTKEILKLGDNYFLFNDIRGPNTQIDHTLICPKGLITIETKTYFFRVGIGNDDFHWYMYLPKHRKSIYSPLRQSMGHADKLKMKLIEQGVNKDVEVYPLVVFAGPKRVSYPILPSVRHRSQLFDYISRLPDKLTNAQIEEYREAIINIANK